MKNETTGANQDSNENSRPASGGSPGFEGYLYQVDVSVWAALDLVLSEGRANEVELEPSSQEDLEAEASLPPSDPGNQGVTVSGGTYRFVIQAKRRSGQPWDVQAFARLLDHGGKQRISARQRLQDPNIRYLLVTNAAVTGVADDVHVDGFGYWPSPGLLPNTLKNLLPDHADGRFAVLRNIDEDRIRHKVRVLLTDTCLVPDIKWEACFEELRRIARAKMIGALNRIWTREELQQVIESFDGCFGVSLDLQRYVQPSNWSELCGALEQKHAIVIAGGSGTGKTMAAEALWEHMRRRVPGLERISISGGPDQVRKTQRTTPVLFDIEDPWGKYRFMPDSQPWKESLSSLLQSARSDRLFIITSRDDVLHDAQAIKAVSHWSVSLEARHYGPRERDKLYENRVGMLPRALQVVATDYREQALRELETPYELQRYFDALLTGDPATSVVDRAKKAIKGARYESIEETIQTQIRQREADVWAPVIWGLLKANPKLPTELVPQIQDRLVERNERFARGLGPLLKFLVAGRSLRESNGLLTYTHPRIEAALEGLLREEPSDARRVLKTLCDVLVSFDDEPEKDWGLTAAAAVTEATVTVKGLDFSLAKDTQSLLDSWLPALLLRHDDSFDSNLLLAARTGSKRCAVAELARFLIDEMTEKMFVFNRDTETVLHDDSWYTWIAADANTRQICDSFVRQILPEERRRFSVRLAVHLTRLAGDLSDAFIYAALEIVHHGVHSNANVIAIGAVENLEAFAPLVDGVLAAYTSPVAAAEWKQTSFEILNGEHNEDYAEHLASQASEEGYAAGELLQTYVKTLRKKNGWVALRDHPRAFDLLRWWLEVVVDYRGRTPLDPEEISALGRLAIGTEHEDKFWEYLSVHWYQSFEDSLRERLTEDVLNARTRRSAALCLLRQAPQHFPSVCDRLLQLNEPTRVLGVFADLHEHLPRLGLSDSEEEALRESILDWSRSVPAPLSELLQPFALTKTENQWTLTPPAVEVAKALSPTDDMVQQAKIRFGLANGFSAEKEIGELLASTDDPEIAVFALESALKTGRADILDGALNHRFARVRACALKAVAARHTGVLPQHILSMAKDKGKYVREALVQVLAERPIDGHFATLVVLADDQWSPWSGHPDASFEYPIAYAAAKGLSQYSSLPAGYSATLLAMAEETRDRRVSAEILCALATNGGDNIRKVIFELAISPIRARVQIAAARALLFSAQLTEDHLVGAIQPDHLSDLPEDVSVILTAIVGLRGDTAAIRSAATHLYLSRARRVFLIVLALAAQDQSDGLASQVAILLPDGHPSIGLLNNEDENVLPKDAIDDLGDVQSVRAVQRFLSDCFVED